MSNLTFISGILSLVFSWLFLLVPALLQRRDYSKIPISHTGTLPKVRWIFNTGLVGAGLSQIIFFLGIWKDSHINIIPLGLILFIWGSLCVATAGLITMARNEKLHTSLATAYFALTPAGALLYLLTVGSTKQSYDFLGIIIALAVITGMLYFHRYKKSMGLTALWGIVTSSLFVLHFYLIIR